MSELMTPIPFRELMTWITTEYQRDGTVFGVHRPYKAGVKKLPIFGETIDQMRAAAPEGQKHIQDYLSAFCFGDIYTRKVLDLQTRELLTLCVISALGGCESQVKAHVQGIANVGNSKQRLIDAMTQCLPYMGFPRTLNALACINAVLPE